MDLQSSKIELIKLILNVENESLINKLKDVLKSEKRDFWSELSDNQKAEIDLGIKQIKEGKTEDWNDFLKRIS